MKSIFKILLTTFHKEYDRQMIIRSLKPLISRKKVSVLANYQISKKIIKICSSIEKGEKWQQLAHFFLSYI